MTNSRHCLRQSSGRHVFLLCLLAGSLWMGNALTGGNANGQPPKDQPPPVIPTATDLAQKVPAIPSAKFVPARVPLNFVIKPDTPLKDLLPLPPKAGAARPRLIDDIAQVPEVAFQEPLAKSSEALRLTAHTMAKINHLNRKKTDG